MTTEIKKPDSEKVGRGPLAPPSDNPKNIIVRSRACPELCRRARKSELKWFADRGFHPEENQKSVASSQKSESQ